MKVMTDKIYKHEYSDHNTNSCLSCRIIFERGCQCGKKEIIEINNETIKKIKAFEETFWKIEHWIENINNEARIKYEEKLDDIDGVRWKAILDITNNFIYLFYNEMFELKGGRKT